MIQPRLLCTVWYKISFFFSTKHVHKNNFFYNVLKNLKKIGQEKIIFVSTNGWR